MSFYKIIWCNASLIIFTANFVRVCVSVCLCVYTPVCVHVCLNDTKMCYRLQFVVIYIAQHSLITCPNLQSAMFFVALYTI